MQTKLYEIGIVGHKTHRSKTAGEIKRLCANTVLTLLDQYEPNLIRVGLVGCIGTAEFVRQACVEYGVDYHLYLPAAPDLCVENKFIDEEHSVKIIADCAGLSQFGTEFSKDNICGAAQALVGASQFIVGFWEGSKYGLTYETIRYAVENSKIVLNGLDGLSLITKQQFVKQRD